MIPSYTRLGLLLIFVTPLAVAACDQPDAPESGARRGAASADPNTEVAQTSSAITVEPRQWGHLRVHAGGNIAHVDIDQYVHADNGGGINCSLGYERYNGPAQPNPTIYQNGNGNCVFLGWENMGNNGQCSAHVLAHSDLFGSIDCDFTVFENRSPENTNRTCIAGGARLCGGVGADGSCFCDQLCRTYGDCCPDATSICGV
jgi:hypothetical protein